MNPQRIDSLINGVSRQAPPQRLISQCEEQVNFVSDPAKGLMSRPFSQHLLKLAGVSLDGKVKSHFIERDDNEHYLLLIRDDTLNVYNLIDGSQCTVTYDEGVLAYLNSTDPENDFHILTVDDTSWITNRTVTVQAAGEIEGEPRAGIVYIKRGLKTTTYSVTLHIPGENITVNYTSITQTAGTAAEYSSITIATEIRDMIVNASSEPDEEGNVSELYRVHEHFSVDLFGSTLRFRPKDEESYFVSVQDSYSDQATVGWVDSYKNYEDLPQNCFDGAKLEITNNSKDDSTHYYLEYVENSGYSTGRWKEAPAWGLQHEIDPATFPLKLVRQSDGTFHLSQCELEPRVAGDADSAQAPYFIGRTIETLGFHANRLGVFCQDHISWSRDGDYYRFYPKTVRQALDDDAFEQTTILEGLCDIKHALPFARSLLIFGTSQQYQVSSDGAFTPRLAVIEPTTANSCSSMAAPVRAGASAYFVEAGTSSSQLWEYYVMTDEVANQAGSITSHVSDYLPADIFSLSARKTDTMLTMLTKVYRNRIYVYNYIWVGNDKAQSAWSYFEFTADTVLIYARFISDRLYMLVERSGEVNIEYIDMGTLGSTIEDTPYIDSRVTLSGSYDAESDTTAFIMPYNISGQELCVVCTEADTLTPRRELIPEVTGNSSFTVKGKHVEVYSGIGYESLYEFTTPYVRNPQRDNAAITGIRTQIQTFQVDYQDSGEFITRVINRDISRDRTKSGVMSTVGLVVNRPRVDSGSFKFPVNAENLNSRIQLVVKSPHAASFQGGGFTGWMAKV